jgi:hypothetical protein
LLLHGAGARTAATGQSRELFSGEKSSRPDGTRLRAPSKHCSEIRGLPLRQDSTRALALPQRATLPQLQKVESFRVTRHRSVDVA